MKTIGSLLVLILLMSCTRDIKYCYYQDGRGYVDKDVAVCKDAKNAKLLNNVYLSVRPHSICQFDKEALEYRTGYLQAKVPVEVIRYYPEDSIAKVIFRTTKRLPYYRIDNRVSRVYVPMLLLHDTLPAVDTVKYIEY